MPALPGTIERYGVIGMGPVGATIAAHLSRAGCDVALLFDEPDKHEAMARAPLTVGGALQAAVQFKGTYLDLGEFLATRPQVVMLATKSCDTAGLLRRIHDHDPAADTVFVACQNGLDVEDRISEVFGPARALRMVLNLGCSFVGPNQVHVAFSYVHFLSERPGSDPRVGRQIAEQLTRAGFQVELRADYRTEVFKKSLLVASLGTVSALTGLTMKAAVDDPDLRRMLKAMVLEGIAVAQAMGLDVPDSFLDHAVDYMSRGGDHKPSMLVDIEHGRRTENEDHCGRILHYAETCGVPVPVTQTVYYLMKQKERKHYVCP